MKKTYFIVLGIFVFNLTIGQNLVEISYSGFPRLIRSSVSWGDYNNDGFLDIALMGGQPPLNPWTLITAIYKNKGNGNFIKIIDLEPLNDGKLEWGDFDGDGDLDLFVAGTENVGTSAGEKSLLYENKGEDKFVLNSTTMFEGILPESIVIVDYDNDGDLDIIMSGAENGTVKTVFYNNGGKFKFTKTETKIPGSIGNLAVADYDRDGDLDIVLSRIEFKNTLVYKNDGKGNYTLDFTIIIETIKSNYTCFVQWVDYDSDGDMDIFFTCISNDFELISKIYINNGANFSQSFSLNDTCIVASEPVWGDFDNDGDLDMFVSGADMNNMIDYTADYKPVIYQNLGNNKFKILKMNVPKVNGDYKLGDYDNDMDLDMLRGGGRESQSPVFYPVSIYQNITNTKNTKAQKPSFLNIDLINDSSVLFSWSAGHDNETNQNGLTYNIYLYNKTTKVFILPPQADTSNGFRRIVENGNVFQNTSWRLYNIPGGKYEFGVQTIDASYIGSEFSKKEFQIGKDPMQNINDIKIDIYPNPTKDFILISSESLVNNMQISIYDLFGRICLRQFGSVDEDLFYKLNVSILKPGIYIIEFRLNNTRQVKKILVY